ncbi:MAG: hypothetical protein LHW59_11565, partial [Candidatus Cloacimonetes bacterium]|nr:hypothetical protein [Candidatus Cloacimonadota bacterium]
MKAKLLITILLILLGTAIFASEDPFDAEEYVRKTQELNQLAERFKAETGFSGEVNHSTRTMKLHNYRGKFSGIHFFAGADTIAFRQACETIIDKILPYSSANRMQLSMSRITKSVRGYTTDYYQQVRGYRVEGAGFIMITFEEGRKRFSIGDNTVELPEVDVSAIISQEEAIRIANQEYFNSNSLTVKPWKVTLAFTNGKDHNNKDYYLCYNLYCGTVVCVDAVTGDIRYTWSRVRVHSISALIKGDVYEKVYTNLNPSPLGYKPLSSVSVSTDSFIGNSDYDGVVIITDSTLVGLSAKLAESPCFYVTVYPDSTNAKTADQYHLGYTPMEIWFDDDSCYTPNVYYHACHQRTKLEEMFNRPYSPNDVLFGLAIVSGDTNMGSGGYFDPVSNKIHLSNSAGKLSHTVRHEMSHCHLYEIVGDYFNTYSSPGSSRNYWAMDEAFAVYFPCAVIEEPDCIYGDPLEITSLLSNNNHVSNISNIFNGNTMVTEDYYSSYYCRYPLASAWWSLRSNPLFPNSVQGVCGVDTLLVNSLEKVGE